MLQKLFKPRMFFATDFTDWHRKEILLYLFVSISVIRCLKLFICVNLCNLWLRIHFVAQLKIDFGKTYLPTVSTGNDDLSCTYLFCKLRHKVKALFVRTQGWVTFYSTTWSNDII